MLLEELIINIPNLIVIQSNTDGITLQFDKQYLNKLEEIKTSWEKFTNYELEEAIYTKMIVRDVSNYISLYDNGKIS